MATTGLSEFSFGFAFLFEQARNNWSGLVAAPILPNLRQEADSGWDAHLPKYGADFYYQFKLSDYLSRANAKYRRDGTYTAPYYRISLHPRDRNRQHQRLRDHSVANVNTYYVAPEFEFLHTFHDSFLAQQITQNSRLIRVADCRDYTDSEQHHITFQTGSSNWIEHSEPSVHEGSRSGRDVENIYRESSESWRPIDRRFASDLLERTTEQVARRIDTERIPFRREPIAELLNRGAGDQSRAELLRRTSDLMTIFYGLTLVITGSR